MLKIIWGNKKGFPSILNFCLTERKKVFWKIMTCKVPTLRAETFAGRKFRVFSVFWSISRKFMPLEILNHQNARAFSPKIKDNLFEYNYLTIFWCFSTFFHIKTKNILKNAKVFSTKFVPKLEKRESFCQKFRVF